MTVTHSMKIKFTSLTISSTMVSMNRLTTERRAQILSMMVEGNSIRAIVRMTGASKNTIVKLLEDAGEAFSAYQDRAFHNLTCKRLQLDEIWAFCYAKQRNVTFAKSAPEEAGDLCTWIALDADTKLVPSWRVGDRSGATAIEFVCDLSKRLANRVQVTSDGHRAYLESIEAGFWADVDYAQLIKLYGEVPHLAGRYGPAQIQGTKTFCCSGDPDRQHISTSYVERQNLTMRNVDAAVHPVEQWLLEEGRKPCPFGRDPLHALQFCADKPKPASDPSDGGGCHDEALVSHRHGAGDRGTGRAEHPEAG
jgi:hypothetical protein